MFDSAGWEAEVGSLFPFPVDLQWLDTFGTTKTIEAGIAAASDIVYVKSS